MKMLIGLYPNKARTPTKNRKLNMCKGSFILYTNHKELIEQLSDEQAGVLMKSLFRYTTKEEMPTLDPVTKMAFTAIRQVLDINTEKYEAKCERLRENGRKGGRPKKDDENQIVDEKKQDPQKILTENQKVFSKSKKSLNDNENEFDNVNENEIDIENVNENVNENDLSSHNGEIVTEKEREILETYVRKNKLATKNVEAYISKIIQNGDHKTILAKETAKAHPKKDPKEIIQEELATMTDKRSTARILYKYWSMGDFPPAEFDEIAEKYDIDTYDKLYNYGQELIRNFENTS